MKIPVLFLGLIVALLAIFLYGARAFLKSRRPHVWDIWVVNLDKDVERWNSIQIDTQRIAGMVHRWPATYGKEMTQKQLITEGVGFAITRSGDGHNEDERLRNLGTVGCWLSHKRLLAQLARLPVAEYAGHLIVEDDVAIPPDFLELGDRWHIYFHRIPTDWDMVYLGLTNPQGEEISPGILRLKTLPQGGGNWGTHAYLVRHGSIQTKLLPALRWMSDAIDEQYNQYFSEWNVYAITPSIIGLKEEMSQNSSLKKINSGNEIDTSAKY